MRKPILRCSECNSEIAEKTQFCPHCGKELTLKTTLFTINTLLVVTKIPKNCRECEFGVTDQTKDGIICYCDLNPYDIIYKWTDKEINNFLGVGGKYPETCPIKLGNIVKEREVQL